jgi:L-iditol 2-dehydrogenase
LLQCLLRKPGDIGLSEAERPGPGRGELLVRIKAALTCGTDIKAFERGHPVIPMPGPFGHEFSGVVEEAGAGVRRFKSGDAVMAVHSAPCLSCSHCKKKLYNLCENIMERKVLGAFGEYVLLPPHIVKQNVFLKPKKLDFAEAALLEPLSCVVHGMEPLSIGRDDAALVAGSGPIGLLHLLLLKKKGAKVAVADPHPARLKKARELGADMTVKPESVERAVKKLTRGMGFDHVFECTGRPRVWEKAVNSLRRGGTLTLFGGCPPGSTVTYDTRRLHYDEITLRGSFHFTPQDAKKARDLLVAGRLGAGRLITGSFPLRDIHKAFRALSRGRGIKYAILP